MLIDLPDEYYDVQAALEGVLADHAAPAELRRLWDEGPTGGDSLWSHVARLGLADLMLPAAHGGEELPLLAAVPLLESLGKFAVAPPVAETIAVVAPALVAELGRPEGQRWFELLSSGERPATVQFGWHGHAPWAAEAGVALVVVGDTVVVCEPDERSVEALDGTDLSRRPGRIGIRAERGVLEAPGAAAAVRRRMLLAHAAVLFGLAEGVVEQSVAYAKVRRQFDRQIGSFQAVKHMLADAYVQWEYHRRYLWFAAWADGEHPSAAMPAAVQAKALAGEVASRVSYTGLQVHGGIGYTWDCDLHMWLSRIQILDAELGSSDVQWRWLAEHGRGEIDDQRAAPAEPVASAGTA